VEVYGSDPPYEITCSKFVCAGVILNYMLESIPQFLPKRLATSIYHWFIGVVFSATVYR